jgi:hypothetical protein
MIRESDETVRLGFFFLVKRRKGDNRAAVRRRRRGTVFRKRDGPGRVGLILG